MFRGCVSRVPRRRHVRDSDRTIATELAAPHLAHKRRDDHSHEHRDLTGRRTMAQTTGRLYDEFAKLMNDATGVAAGMRREFETVLRTQAERILRDLDVVQREEFEAVKEMARLAREENEALKARIAALEAKVAAVPTPSNPVQPQVPPQPGPPPVTM
jgi:BMFP domain-containing protein YqiC